MRKNSNPASKMILSIPFADITNVYIPPNNEASAIISGIKGIEVSYKEGTKDKMLKFWAIGGFSHFLDTKRMNSLLDVMSKIWDIDKTQIEAAKSEFGSSKYIIASTIIFVTVLCGGFISGILVAAALYISYYIYKRDDIEEVWKIIIIVGIVAIVLILTLIIHGLAFFSMYPPNAPNT